jgi:hypothetical protein
MTLINDSGVTLETVTLPMLQDYTLFSDRVAVSPDGRYMAYTLMDAATYYLAGALYDKETNVVQLLYPAEGENALYGMQWAAHSYQFSDTGFATGYSLEGGSWRVMVQPFNNSGRVSLDSNSAVAVTSGLPSGVGITPIVQYFSATKVIFTLFMLGLDSPSVLQTYVWDYVTGDVQWFGGTPLVDIDVFPSTGEIISAYLDTNFPNRMQDYVLYPQANTLHIYVPQTASRFPFYTEAALSFYQPRFVENGRRILVGLFDEFSNSGEWRLLERSGQSVQPINVLRTPNDFVIDALGVADGFVYVTSVLSNDGTTTLMHVDTTDGLDAGRIVWIGATAAQQRLVWVNDSRAQTTLSEPFIAWGQLAGAQSDIISPLALPTQPAVSGASLVIGGAALINTTEGDQLNMRSGAGTSFDIVTQLDDGTRVTIIEGPRLVDGLTWWRIQVGNLQGWVVESVEDDGAIIQTLIPG